ncbi:MAG: DNA-binding protein AraC-type, partial [Anaerocolumna sp.]|nr:DNA-binding protein AraC-type [Anaerocolumna sp.]
GFVYLDKELTELLQPFMIHSNSYCMMVKSNKLLWNKCQEMKKPIAEKCRRLRGTFYGRCHAGVEEYILPIFSNDQLIGTVHAGVFSSYERNSVRSVKEIARSARLNEHMLLELYHGAISSQVPEVHKINSLLGIAAEYIRRIYDDFTITNPKLFSHIRFNSGEDNILGHTLEFIKRNYKEQISVLEVANFCHCSVSYINHTFKRRMKVNIREYINRLRVDAAKSYLTGTSLPIKEVSSCVGFHDPNYFCKVFSEICGVPPTVYRKVN